jgi:phage-related protein (TIGR01555 family)
MKANTALRVIHPDPVARLQLENQELRNGLDLMDKVQNKSLENSLVSLMQGAQNQTQMASMTNLAYFNIYAPLTLNWVNLTYMYKTHGIIQTAIDMPVLDALRGGVDLTSDELDGDDLKDLQDNLEETGTLRTIAELAVWVRLYGGGGLVINSEQDPEVPLDEMTMKRMELYPANRWELVSTSKEADFFQVFGKRVHHSRVLTMSGKPAPYLVRTMLQGWGMSEVEKMIEPFNAYLRINDVIYELLREAKLDVYRFKNFTGQLASKAGMDMVFLRAQTMNQIKSYQNAVVMDAEDEFEQKQISFAGLADMKKQNQVDVASALRIPMTKLFGISAAGFSSGEDDIENYCAMIESEIREPLRPIIRAVINLRCIEMFGDSFDISFQYKPLRILSSVDEESVKTSKHARYTMLYDKGLLTAEETMDLMQSEKMVNIQTEVGGGAEPEPPGGGMVDENKGFPGEPDKTPSKPQEKGKAKSAQEAPDAE